MDKMKTSGIKKKVLEEITQLAVEYHVQKVILFGSRARGDYWERSDIDLAVCLPVQQELKNRIYQEGIVIYEKI